MTAKTIITLMAMAWAAGYGLLCAVRPYRPCPCQGTNVRLRLGRRAWNAAQRARQIAGRAAK